MRNRYKSDLNRLVDHPRRRGGARALRNPGALNSIFSSAKMPAREAAEPVDLQAFATIPRSDDAPNGWGLPDDGGIGTAGGSSPWIYVRPADYQVTRFVDTIEHGNLYYKPANPLFPIISWVGPQNGYLFNAFSMTTYGNGGITQVPFGVTLFAYGRAIATSSGQEIIGAAIRQQGAGYRLLSVVQENSGQIRLDYADLGDLAFSQTVDTWVSVYPPSNPEVTGGAFESDGVVRFNGTATRCVWMWAGDGYEWDIDANTVTRLNLSYTLPNDVPFKPMINVSDSFADYVTNPCGDPEPWPRTITQTETLDQDWAKVIDQQALPVCIDFVDGEHAVFWLKSGTFASEIFSYTSVHTHTRDAVCGIGYPSSLETVNFSGTESQRQGFYYAFDDADLSDATYAVSEFSSTEGQTRSVSADVRDAEDQMRIRVGSLAAVDSLEWKEIESCVRYVDLANRVAIYTSAETVYAGEDTDGMRLWTWTRRHFILVDGQKTTFRTDVFATNRQEDILDQNGNVIVLDPSYPTFKVSVASDRSSQKVFVSITDDSDQTVFNYLTGSDPVSETSVTGTNPRFSPVTII